MWSGSQHYARGKYIADGVWSSTAVSQQIGAMVILQQLATLTTIDVPTPRQRRSPAVTRSAAQDRLGSANEMRLNTTAVGTLAGVGGVGAASLAQHAGTMPSWQTLTTWMVGLAFIAYVAPRLWRFMNAR